MSEASAWGEVDFTCLDEKLIHIPSAAAKITSSAPAVLRIRLSQRFRYGYLREGLTGGSGVRDLRPRGEIDQIERQGKLALRPIRHGASGAIALVGLKLGGRRVELPV